MEKKCIEVKLKSNDKKCIVVDSNANTCPIIKASYVTGSAYIPEEPTIVESVYNCLHIQYLITNWDIRVSYFVNAEGVGDVYPMSGGLLLYALPRRNVPTTPLVFNVQARYLNWESEWIMHTPAKLPVTPTPILGSPDITTPKRYQTVTIPILNYTVGVSLYDQPTVTPADGSYAICVNGEINFVARGSQSLGVTYTISIRGFDDCSSESEVASTQITTSSTLRWNVISATYLGIPLDYRIDVVDTITGTTYYDVVPFYFDDDSEIYPVTFRVDNNPIVHLTILSTDYTSEVWVSNARRRYQYYPAPYVWHRSHDPWIASIGTETTYLMGRWHVGFSSEQFSPSGIKYVEHIPSEDLVIHQKYIPLLAKSASLVFPPLSFVVNKLEDIPLLDRYPYPEMTRQDAIDLYKRRIDETLADSYITENISALVDVSFLSVGSVLATHWAFDKVFIRPSDADIENLFTVGLVHPNGHYLPRDVAVGTTTFMATGYVPFPRAVVDAILAGRRGYPTQPTSITYD